MSETAEAPRYKPFTGVSGELLRQAFAAPRPAPPTDNMTDEQIQALWDTVYDLAEAFMEPAFDSEGEACSESLVHIIGQVIFLCWSGGPYTLGEVTAKMEDFLRHQQADLRIASTTPR